MERVSVNKRQMVIVGDSVARELNYYYKTILDSISVSENTTSKLSWACCDNKVNQDARGGAYCCKYCRRKGRSDADADKLDHIISSASLYGLCISTGSLVGSQLSTTCPRLQKHGESLASLTFGSYLDVTHSIINPEAMDLIDQQKKALEGPVSKEGRSKAKEFERRKVENGGDEEKYDKAEEEDEYIEEFHPCVGEMLIDETASDEEKGEEGHPLLVPFDTNNHINVLSHLSLSGGSIHTRGMKFKSDRNLKSTGGDIPLTSPRIECKCTKAARKVYQEQQQKKMAVKE
uniref:Wsv133-like protein n=1 Tax=Hemigrapsus takanoi nimavirus TaxID=2133792 RepID=A0A401IP13_9VIRU|nr:MAG: wsv133-like protein [Hemigrapsus takanoi nimavirus]GBG35358.1 wsv133-like protein [Hemigrapsus takanoi nimavirus]